HVRVERSRWLSQVPSPAQAATVDWHVQWCIRDPPIDQLALCIAAYSGSALNNSVQSMPFVILVNR
ncbi:MAG: hypothetical protein KDA72_19395, partial [Planctomycetales bacterium]|nr:hypothetical protein [Planctomycetales bacterium]